MSFHEFFESKFQHMYSIFVSISSECMHFICEQYRFLKRYYYDQSDQFDEFFTVIYGGFLALGLTVRGRRRQPAHPPKSAKKFPFMQGVVHK